MKYVVGTEMTIRYPENKEEPNKVCHWKVTKVHDWGVSWTVTNLKTKNTENYASYWEHLTEEKRKSKGIQILSVKQPWDLPDEVFEI